MSSQELSSFIGRWLPRLEDEMRDMLHSKEAAVAAHYGMMGYHMGWLDEQFNTQISPSGKRLRPMLCLLACAEMGGDPIQALPAATAIELLHNFSLIHDDIEDGDETRRHRPTVWKIWGVPQAINAGDGMFTLAFAAMQRLVRRGVSADHTLQALNLFTQTCLKLTEGQHLDMSFEQRIIVSVDEYMRMIQGKTAALVGASVAIGALMGGAAASQVSDLQQFGEAIGLAFQIQDDILGIWGNPEETGKAAGNDILRRKKSLPILHALNHDRVGEQFETLFDSELSPTQLPKALDLLEQAGTRQFTEAAMRHQHELGLAALRQALDERVENSMLFGLTDGLLNRRS
ncbi:MAG: polyprenyl synthetase family protein [Chloroflexi bacterium]|nr:polyprenyl synthetase family protein [Chloroflexota bacterium]